MEGLLREFEGEAERTPGRGTSSGASTRTTLGYGFSEYASYVSYMIQNHPDEVKVKRRRTWTRYPPGASLGVAALKLISPNHLCCPTDSFLKLVKPLGYEFMGFEIGHSSLLRLPRQGARGELRADEGGLKGRGGLPRLLEHMPRGCGIGSSWGLNKLYTILLYFARQTRAA